MSDDSTGWTRYCTLLSNTAEKKKTHYIGEIHAGSHFTWCHYLFFLVHNADVGVSLSPAVQEMDHKPRQLIIILLHIVIFPNTLMTNDRLYCRRWKEREKDRDPRWDFMALRSNAPHEDSIQRNLLLLRHLDRQLSINSLWSALWKKC